jgi:hypothetical protein
MLRMAPLLQSVVALGTVLAVSAARRAAIATTGYLIAGLMLATSLGFFTLAIYRALRLSVGDIYALLIVGCGYFVASLIALLIVQFKRR